MIEFDNKILEDKMSQLPEEIQEALTSTDTTKEIKKIAEKYDLHIDQESVLYDLTAYVLLGLVPSKDFVEKLTVEGKIRESDARAIANDINSDIVNKIRSSIRDIQNTDRKVADDEGSDHSIPDTIQPAVTIPATPIDHSDIERAGGFTVEASHHAETKAQNLPVETHADVESREHILNHIENPQGGSEKISRKESSIYTEPLMDHLLQNPVSSPKLTIETAHTTPSTADIDIVTPPAPVITSRPVIKIAPMQMSASGEIIKPAQVIVPPVVTPLSTPSRIDTPSITPVSTPIPVTPTPIPTTPKPPTPPRTGNDPYRETA